MNRATRMEISGSRTLRHHDAPTIGEAIATIEAELAIAEAAPSSPVPWLTKDEVVNNLKSNLDRLREIAWSEMTLIERVEYASLMIA
jgi:hypothetical protein